MFADYSMYLRNIKGYRLDCTKAQCVLQKGANKSRISSPININVLQKEACVCQLCTYVRAHSNPVTYVAM